MKTAGTAGRGAGVFVVSVAAACVCPRGGLSALSRRCVSTVPHTFHSPSINATLGAICTGGHNEVISKAIVPGGNIGLSSAPSRMVSTFTFIFQG